MSRNLVLVFSLLVGAMLLGSPAIGQDPKDDPVAAAIGRVKQIEDAEARLAKPVLETADLVRQMNSLEQVAKTKPAVRLRLREFQAIAAEFPKVRRDLKVLAPNLKDLYAKSP